MTRSLRAVRQPTNVPQEEISPATESVLRALVESARAVAPSSSVDAAQRRAMIAEAAYFLAQQRSGTSGSHVDDWLAAEQQIDSSLLTR